jgi:putative DNA primase/helicase
MTESFYGREDLGLSARLAPELPGILRWALAGLERLTARGHFVQPASGRETIEALEDLTSPVGAFLRARCEVGPEQSIDCDRLFQAWMEWCREQHRDAVGTVHTFGRDLRAAVRGLDVRQPRSADGKRRREYQGVGLQSEFIGGPLDGLTEAATGGGVHVHA